MSIRKLCCFSLGVVIAVAESAEHHTVLEEITVVESNSLQKGAVLNGKTNVGEKIVDSKTLKRRGANLGDALSTELGIHASQFGGGSSAPIIRGQEGKRIKILSHNSETLDMSSMSPDHAVTVDSMLAEQVEVLRGANTLLYSSGNSAGVINVVDQKIPTVMPEKILQGEIGSRFNSADNERLVHTAINAKLGSQFALHLEGLKRDTNDYRTPAYQREGKTYHKLADSFSDSQSGTLGLSWIGSKGYLGFALSERKDKYGLPAHTHIYEKYYIDLIPTRKMWNKPYLKHYPFLMEETDIDYNNPGLQCIKRNWHAHSHLCEEDLNHAGHNHGHNHATAEHQHDHSSPYIALHTKRIDLRSELNIGKLGVDKIKLNTGWTKYRHDEKTDSAIDGAFANKGHNLRLELVHSPLWRLTGAFGVQELKQSTHALNPNTLAYRRQHLLQDHTSTQHSVFWFERLSWDKWQVDFATRWEKQRIKLDYNQDLTDYPTEDAPAELKTPHNNIARSYAITLNYQPTEQHQFTLTASHQERLPNAQELFAHGKHLATNSFDTGNKNLTKERSNNIDLGWSYLGEKLDFTLNGYYNRFQNYIYLATLNNGICRHGGRCSRALSGDFPLRINRYNQSAAKIYGLEAEIGYQFTPNLHLALFGDYVRGKLKNLPALPTGYDYYGNTLGWRTQPDGNAPRMPARRVGLRVNAMLNHHITANLEAYRVFKQKQVALLENPTAGHTMLNLGLSYEGSMNHFDYTLFMNANNLLNAKVYNHASFLSYIPQAGRSLGVGVNVKF